MAAGRVKLDTYGGRTFEAPIGLAVEMEDATGLAIAELAVAGHRLRFGHACIIVGKLLEQNGVEVSQQLLLDMADKHGIAAMQIDAARTINAFFARPEKAEKVKSAGKSQPAKPAAGDSL